VIAVAPFNVLQAADVTGDGATTRPDLVSAQFFDGRIDGTPAGFDQVIYTFDESVLVPTSPPQCAANCFTVYKADGREVFGGTVANQPTVRSGENDRQVIVTFADGSIDGATGASVRDGAVLEAVGTGGVNRTNREDEVEVQGVTFSSGLTNAPDFVACELEVTGRDPISGSPNAFQLVFVFDEAVRAGGTTDLGPGPDPARFFVYNANGDLIAPRTAGGASSTANPQRRGAPQENEVLMEGFANQSDLQTIVSCAVAEGAVIEKDSSAAPNPIGYEVIS